MSRRTILTISLVAVAAVVLYVSGVFDGGEGNPISNNSGLFTPKTAGTTTSTAILLVTKDRYKKGRAEINVLRSKKTLIAFGRSKIGFMPNNSLSTCQPQGTAISLNRYPRYICKVSTPKTRMTPKRFSYKSSTAAVTVLP